MSVLCNAFSQDCVAQIMIFFTVLVSLKKKKKKRSRVVGPVSSKRRWGPRDTVLRGVRVEKKQVNSVFRLHCEPVGSLYFTYLVISVQGSGTISCPKTL